MMTVDSNVLVYLHDDSEADKQSVAALVMSRLMERETRIGLQCVGEFQNVLRRKLRAPSWQAAEEARNLLVSFESFAATEGACLAALGVVSTGRGGYWDTLLMHSAADAGCTVMFTEDDQGAPRVGGLEIVNPFGPEGVSARARDLLDL